MPSKKPPNKQKKKAVTFQGRTNDDKANPLYQKVMKNYEDLLLLSEDDEMSQISKSQPVVTPVKQKLRKNKPPAGLKL